MNRMDLVGAKEAAVILGVARTNLRRDVPDLPKPYSQPSKRYPLWKREDIKALAKERKKTKRKRAKR
jgi:hypothetical protein